MIGIYSDKLRVGEHGKTIAEDVETWKIENNIYLTGSLDFNVYNLGCMAFKKHFFFSFYFRQGQINFARSESILVGA